MVQGKPNPKMAALKRRILKFWTLSRLMASSVAIVLFISSIVASYVGIEIMLSNKLKDSWAILYLNIESLTLRTQVLLNQCCRPQTDKVSIKNSLALYEYHQENGEMIYKKISGSYADTIKPFELGFTQPPQSGIWHFTQYGEKPIIVLFKGGYLNIWSHSLDQLFDQEKSRTTDTKIYVANRSGLLLFSNDPEILQSNFKNRPLVAEFIKRKVTNSQLELVDKHSGTVYGFFQEVPGTNLVIFAETLKSKVFAIFWKVIFRSLLYLLALIAASIILVTIPASHLLKPIGELSNLAVRIGNGDFSTLPKTHGYGELGPLVDSFGNMMANLVARDQAIKKLSEDQLQKLRMANELAVAKSLQDNFIKTPALYYEQNGLNFAISYEASEECAGDWYSVHSDQKTNDITVAIADVSGHGAGSAMFTAIIAALFDERLEDLSNKHEDFFQSVHERIRNLAHGKMHASLQIVTWLRQKGQLKITNAGHPFPLFRLFGADKPIYIRTPSAPLGLSDQINIQSKTIDVSQGFRLMLYTDGLTEARKNQTNDLFGTKRLLKVFESSGEKDCKSALDQILTTWKNHLAGQIPNDDTCAIILEGKEQSALKELAA